MPHNVLPLYPVRWTKRSRKRSFYILHGAQRHVMGRGSFNIKHYFQITFYFINQIGWDITDFFYQSILINRTNLINHNITRIFEPKTSVF